MKLLSMYAATLIVAGSFETAHATEKESADPVWHQDFVKAKSIARQSRKPLFVVFR
ncbi:MAG: hypothetical protein IID46_00930 [Planctomycetes bacterium]|nr:hypothetical protein [Planctomycetota bacterium]